MTQAGRASVLLDLPGFSAVVVVTNGTMARMNLSGISQPQLNAIARQL